MAEAVAGRASGFLEGEGQILPALLGIVAEVSSLARDPGASLRTGLGGEEHCGTGAHCRASGDADGEEPELLPVSRLVERAAARRRLCGAPADCGAGASPR